MSANTTQPDGIEAAVGDISGAVLGRTAAFAEFCEEIKRTMAIHTANVNNIRVGVTTPNKNTAYLQWSYYVKTTDSLANRIHATYDALTNEFNILHQYLQGDLLAQVRGWFIPTRGMYNSALKANEVLYDAVGKLFDRLLDTVNDDRELEQLGHCLAVQMLYAGMPQEEVAEEATRAGIPVPNVRIGGHPLGQGDVSRDQAGASGGRAGAPGGQGDAPGGHRG